MKLYEISQEYEQILDQLYDDETGEINEQSLIKLEQNQLAMEQKAIAISSFIKNMDAEREAIKSAKESMAQREKSFKKRIDQLEGYLIFNMEKCGINEFKCPYFAIKLKKCPPSVDILDKSAIPDEYTVTKTEIVPNKIKMLQEMKAGICIPGVTIKHNLKLDIR